MEKTSKEKKLEVRDLRIRFRTSGGMVQAVRGISFDLYAGETLAIVGESGSGKSVTSKAIMGISAINAVTESGEILYDGSDLLKFSEADFQTIRGNRIAMIFQDPLSSLNPIVRVGKQLTEAMILRNRVDRAACRRQYREKLAELKRVVAQTGDPASAEAFARRIAAFEAVEKRHIELESRYLLSREAAEEADGKLGQLLVAIEKKPARTVVRAAQNAVRLFKRGFHEALVPPGDGEAETALAALDKAVPGEPMYAALRALKDKLEGALAAERPDFFAAGYFAANGLPVPGGNRAQSNRAMREKLDEGFLRDFVSLVAEAARLSRKTRDEAAERALPLLDGAAAELEKPIGSKRAKALIKSLTDAVDGAIDRLDVRRDSGEYTFRGNAKGFYKLYFGAEKRNRREQKRFERHTAKREKALARGKTPDWKVAPPALVDLDAVRGKFAAAVVRLAEGYRARLSENFDGAERAGQLVAFFQRGASGSLTRVTKGMAKNRAIKLMEEVGLPEPEKRFSQYPFEMSGGQRQRIVIAIALSANPDVLICDEPTTALDVTIQSQILELINRVKRERGLSVIFITHDLGVVANMADRIAVMYAGKIVECGTAEDVFYAPAHPYTWALLSSVPDLDSKDKLEAIPGTPPNMIYPPKGDAFAERNRYALDIDFREEPPMFRISETHSAATWLLHPLAPRVPVPAAVSARIERMRRAEEAARD